jgi:hypothetical protein
MAASGTVFTLVSAAAAVLLMLTVFDSSICRANGAPVAPPRQMSSRISQPAPQLAQAYSIDDLQNVNYSNPRPWQINRGKYGCVQVASCIFGKLPIDEETKVSRIISYLI